MPPDRTTAPVIGIYTPRGSSRLFAPRLVRRGGPRFARLIFICGFLALVLFFLTRSKWRSKGGGGPGGPGPAEPLRKEYSIPIPEGKAAVCRDVMLPSWVEDPDGVMDGEFEESDFYSEEDSIASNTTVTNTAASIPTRFVKPESSTTAPLTVSERRAKILNLRAKCKCTYVGETWPVDPNSNSGERTFQIFRAERSLGVHNPRSRPCTCAADVADHEPSPTPSPSSPWLDTPPKHHVVILSVLRDGLSWGTGRNLLHHLLMLASVPSPAKSARPTPPISIGLLVSSPDEYERIVSQLSALFLSTSSFDPSILRLSTLADSQFATCTVRNWILKNLNIQTIYVQHLRDPDYKVSDGADVDRSIRHLITVQTERRRKIARIRNRAMMVAFNAVGRIPSAGAMRNARLHQDEFAVSPVTAPTHFLWVDTDVLHMPTWDDIDTMLESQKDIITVRCVRGELPDYDQNAWVGPRTTPNETEREDIRKGGLFVPFPTTETRLLIDLATNFHLLSRLSEESKRLVRLNNYVRLDSVGGTFLLIRAPVVLDGVNFPPYHVVGAEWGREGWDGIETEGLCFVAKTLGYWCWGMPDVTTIHDPS
ncbi:hypothetical protein BJ742DRAFT_573114 [Cladochytrium replicatum]|nr:hypothetical protein BJ742DRAFT_573114 [Cladochytrium replicatum]